MLTSEFRAAHGHLTGVVDVERGTVRQACFNVWPEYVRSGTSRILVQKPACRLEDALTVRRTDAGPQVGHDRVDACSMCRAGCG